MVLAMVCARCSLVAGLLAVGIAQDIWRGEKAARTPPMSYHAHVPTGGSFPARGGLEIAMAQDPSVDEFLQDVSALWAQTASVKRLAGDSGAFVSIGSVEGRSSRRLQETCVANDPFTLSSPIYVDAEGCYTMQDEALYIAYEMVNTSRVIMPITSIISTSYSSITESSTQTFWAVGDLFVSTDNNLHLDLECFGDYVPGTHPTYTDTWICILGSFLVEVSGDSFNLECGCEEDMDDDVKVAVTPSPKAIPEVTSISLEVTSTPSEAALTQSEATPTPSEPAPAGDVKCGGTDPFSITSELLPTLEGCYTDTGNVTSIIWSQTGESMGGNVFVYADYVDQNNMEPRWFVGTDATSTTDDSLTATCISRNEPSENHPASSSWACDFTGTKAFSLVEDDQFRVDCDCEATSTVETPSPQSATNVVDTNQGTERVSSVLAATLLAYISFLLLVML